MSQWASIRRALAPALQGRGHRLCFLHGVRQVLQQGFGRAALQHRGGEAVAAQWRLEGRSLHPPKRLPDASWRTFHCDDADLRGVHDLIFDGIERGEVSVPSDASVRRAGEELTAATTVPGLHQRCCHWLQQAQAWSRCPGAGAAFVIAVKEGRIVWVGVHVTRGPRVSFDA